jgi:prepilin-type N-terminal cleavage/methylation domain-containing protein
MTTRETRGEAGYTLTEVLVAVTILTVAIVVIVGAMSSGILASRVHRDIVTSDAVVRQYAEQLVSVSYVSCANTTSSQYPAMSNVPAGYTATIASIKYWNGSTPAAFGTTCGTDAGVQQITIEAHRATGAGSQTLQVLKRQP